MIKVEAKIIRNFTRTIVVRWVTVWVVDSRPYPVMGAFRAPDYSQIASWIETAPLR